MSEKIIVIIMEKLGQTSPYEYKKNYFAFNAGCVG